MAIYLDTANIADVARLVDYLPLAGVTTNPSLLLAAAEQGQHLTDQGVLSELLRVCPGTIFIQPMGKTADEIAGAAQEYISRDPARVVPKLPMSAAGLQAGRTLKAQGARIAFTATMTVSQAYCGVAVGTDWIIPYFGRLRKGGMDACGRVGEMARMLRTSQASCRILVASLKSANDVADALEAGAHDITVTPDVLTTLAHDALTDESLTGFARDWQQFQALASEWATR